MAIGMKSKLKSQYLTNPREADAIPTFRALNTSDPPIRPSRMRERKQPGNVPPRVRKSLRDAQDSVLTWNIKRVYLVRKATIEFLLYE